MRHYTTTSIRPVIKWFNQAEPPEFFTAYHKRRGTLEECVNDMVDTISGEFYVVEEEGCMAAFFGKAVCEGVAVLEGFHILPAFRHAAFVGGFWEVVRGVFGQDIYIGLSPHNQPAIKHLQRNGFRLIEELEYENKTFTLFTNKLSD